MTDNPKPGPTRPDEQLVVFSKGTLGLPAAIQKAIERQGLRTLEKAGVAPTWKPTKPSEYLVGDVLAVRPDVGEFGGTVVVINTPEGPQSVWLGADLKTKMSDVRVGQVYCIVYDGILTKKDNPKLKNDMRLYKVVEILPPEK